LSSIHPSIHRVWIQNNSSSLCKTWIKSWQEIWFTILLAFPCKPNATQVPSLQPFYSSNIWWRWTIPILFVLQYKELRLIREKIKGKSFGKEFCTRLVPSVLS
jgi:hypothetical protein